jgi:hypothetical protein
VRGPKACADGSSEWAGFAKGCPDFTWDRCRSESSLRLAVLKREWTSILLQVDYQGNQITSRMNTGLPKRVFSPRPCIARSAELLSTYSTILHSAYADHSATQSMIGNGSLDRTHPHPFD